MNILVEYPLLLFLHSPYWVLILGYFVCQRRNSFPNFSNFQSLNLLSCPQCRPYVCMITRLDYRLESPRYMINLLQSSLDLLDESESGKLLS